MNTTDSFVCCIFFLKRQWVVGQVEYLSQHPDYYDFHIDPANRLWKSLSGNKKSQVGRGKKSGRLVCQICSHFGYFPPITVLRFRVCQILIHHGPVSQDHHTREPSTISSASSSGQCCHLSSIGMLALCSIWSVCLGFVHPCLWRGVLQV
jgi:hypothetical protein